jgi:hypothetical protein
MPGKSALTADAAEQSALRALSKSEERGEADRARAILLTLGEGKEGRGDRHGPRSARQHGAQLAGLLRARPGGGAAAAPEVGTESRDWAARRGDPEQRDAPR